MTVFDTRVKTYECHACNPPCYLTASLYERTNKAGHCPWGQRRFKGWKEVPE
jgi:hypothetical protein